MNLKPGLYLVSTPIGNLNDITLRAINTLKNSDTILCEDTRISRKLLEKHEISNPLLVYNDKSNEKRRLEIAKMIDNDKVISLISDAGTPLISDPGYKLVKQLKQDGYFVEVIAGICSPIAALTVSGMPTDRFTFLGFLPKTLAAKEKLFTEFKELDTTLIFFETSNRLLSSLEIAIQVLGNREACVAREMTKIFQETKLDLLTNLYDYYKLHQPRGEIVLLISGKGESEISIKQITAELLLQLQQNNSAKTATDIIYQKYKNNFSRNEIYKIANKLKNK
ncbi:MAG: 16S rRNA (cytidine(1402)-2'-O)-methyltransferase [Rickettsiaceae bacterium]|nr:16S rRNA (cytidine(1402)-2'-O)-methyltransferase [Rickettsiaceae bacterium]